MRNVVLALALLNLAFFAYTVWIDQPPVSAADAAPALPRLLLASEFPQTHSAARGAVPKAAEASAGVESSVEGAPLPPVAQANTQPAEGPGCVAVGPFVDIEVAGRAASVLKERGFEPKQRAATGEIPDGYWVHVGNITSAAEESRLMRSLVQAGLSDASPIQSPDRVRQISVGIFRELARAERRASAVKRLGIEAEVSPRRRPGTVYWLEVQPKAGYGTVSADGIPGSGEPIEVRACSASPSRTPIAKR